MTTGINVGAKMSSKRKYTTWFHVGKINGSVRSQEKYCLEV